jgi:hypothetical protein
VCSKTIVIWQMVMTCMEESDHDDIAKLI